VIDTVYVYRLVVVRRIVMVVILLHVGVTVTVQRAATVVQLLLEALQALLRQAPAFFWGEI